MIQLEALCKTYGKSGVKAVDALSLSVKNGEIFGFLGPNGAGKTTTIKMISGILKPDSGSVFIDGIDMSREPVSAKMRMAYVPDNPDMFARLKASEYLNFIADIYEVTTADRQARIEEFAKLLKIDSVLNGKIGSFSHGMKQKLAITASLLSDPENWILDEPMVGLDPEAAYLLKSIMKKRTDAGKAVFFSTHVMEVAERLCDRIGVIHQGRIVFAGTVEELKTLKGSDDTLENLFLELVESDVMN